MTKKCGRKIKVLAMLASPCASCQQIWAIVTGTPRKRESVKCYTRGHRLIGKQAATKRTYKQLVKRAA